MATITGTDGNDGIYGTAYADTISGGLGGDTITGGGGDDSVEGGDGDDNLQVLSLSDGNDTLVGGAGNDRIWVHMDAPVDLQHTQVDGGEGNDTIIAEGIAGFMGPVAPDGVTATGGAGQDTYIINDYAGLAVTDFVAGVGGDHIDLADLLAISTAGGYVGGNPFAAGIGFLRLVQSGADTLLQYDVDGAAFGWFGWHTTATLRNVDMSLLTAENFLGIAPDGSPVAGQVITGTASAEFLWGGFFNDTISSGEGDDTLDGSGGSDWIDAGAGNDRLEQSAQGDDTLFGGDGNDFFFLLSSGDNGPQALEVHGGDGDDEIWVGRVANASGSVLASGGAGQDTYSLFYGDHARGLTITDFQAGVDGDHIDIESLLPYISYYLWWVGDGSGSASYEGGNPFAAEQGYFRLVQEGAHTLLQFDPDGAADVAHDWHTAAVLQDVDASTLTADNFSGIAPDGSAIAGEDLVGTELADELQGWLGGDTLRGGLGNDSLDGAPGADLLEGGDGDDTLQGERGGDTLLGGAGRDKMDGSTGDDILDGGDGDDTLVGVGTSSDTLVGGAGSDMFYVFLHGSTERQSVRAIGGSGDDFFLTSVEQDSSTILFTGGAGQDTYSLGRWSPSGAMPHGIAVTDFATGAGGDLLEISSLLPHSANFGAFTSDNPFSPASGYLRFVQSGTDTLLRHDEDGAEGTASGWQTVMRFKGVALSDLSWDNFVAITRNGLDSSEMLIGGLGRDTLSGAGGNDTLNGGWGGDLMVGGVGDDTYGVHDVDDVVEELAGQGVDNVRATIDWMLGANQENLVLDAGAVRGTGNELANAITGTDAANVVDGGEGQEPLDGGLGNDKYRVDVTGDSVLESADAGIDLVVSTAASYTLGANVEDGRIAGDGAASLTGNALANVLQGGAGDNRVDGGLGDDVLAGGRGRDVLVGGPGRDVFTFHARSDSTVASAGRDTIADFVGGLRGDRIDLSGIDSNAGTEADEAFIFIRSEAFSSTDATGQLRYVYDRTSGAGILYGSTDADSAAEFAIEITGVTGLALANLVL